MFEIRYEGDASGAGATALLLRDSDVRINAIRLDTDKYTYITNNEAILKGDIFALKAPNMVFGVRTTNVYLREGAWLARINKEDLDVRYNYNLSKMSTIPHQKLVFDTIEHSEVYTENKMVWVDGGNSVEYAKLGTDDYIETIGEFTTPNTNIVSQCLNQLPKVSNLSRLLNHPLVVKSFAEALSMLPFRLTIMPAPKDNKHYYLNEKAVIIYIDNDGCAHEAKCAESDSTGDKTWDGWVLPLGYVTGYVDVPDNLPYALIPVTDYDTSSAASIYIQTMDDLKELFPDRAIHTVDKQFAVDIINQIVEDDIRNDNKAIAKLWAKALRTSIGDYGPRDLIVIGDLALNVPETPPNGTINVGYLSPLAYHIDHDLEAKKKLSVKAAEFVDYLTLYM